MESEKNWIGAIGKPTFESIEAMVDAANVDYDRLEELLEYYGNDFDLRCESDNQDDWDKLTELKSLAGEHRDEDSAREAIQEDPLGIEIGGFWGLGAKPEATEYRIILGTGGPATRIVGDLDQHNQPSSARLEVQDWFKPWTEYPCNDSVLLEYAQQFCFGE